MEDLSPLVRLGRTTQYTTRDGLWVVHPPIVGRGWQLRPSDWTEVGWFILQTDHPNRFANLAEVARFLRENFREATHPDQTLGSLAKRFGRDHGAPVQGHHERVLARDTR